MTLLFDLDGTLSDSRPGILNCARHALAGLGEDVPSDEVLASFIGPPLREMFTTLLGGAGNDRIEDAVHLYRERYEGVGLYEAELYDGVVTMLTRAREGASRLFVATAKARPFAVRVLDHFGLSGFFDGVYGAELDGRFDAKTELIGHLLEVERLAPAGAVMVGDRGVDVRAARANGLPAIGVLWGYGSREELVDAGASALCEAPAHLERCLAW
jgi:phosphoglycolate phosphatase